MNKLNPGTHALLVAGTHLTMFAWLISVAYGSHDPVTAAIITGLMVGSGIWNFFSVRGRNGLAVAVAVNAQMAIYGLIVLLVFNLRLDVWMASARGMSLAEIHALFSPWIIPSLTLALIGWIAMVWAATKPAAPAFDEGISRAA